MQAFNMGGVPPVTFGAGQVVKASSVVARLGGGPVLVIADAVLTELGITGKLAEVLSTKNIPFLLADDISGEPKQALVNALCQRARDMDAKLVIGLGGGAAMDAAKLVAAIANSGQPAEDFDLAAQPLPKNGMPSIAIPTTAGTGSEVTRTSVISREDGSKGWFWGEELMFSQAILDPELTLSLPPNMTAWTGIDAVSHALEGATARNTNPAGLLYGLEALRTLARHLPEAVEDGANLEARSRVLWGSMVAGLALHNCNTHMGHNISHALGSLSRVHHGLATGLALEASLPWLVERPEGADNYARAAAALGSEQAPRALPGAFSRVMRACQVPAELPRECAEVTVEALAQEMKAPANHGMALNAACPVTDDGLHDMAARLMRFQIAS